MQCQHQYLGLSLSLSLCRWLARATYVGDVKMRRVEATDLKVVRDVTQKQAELNDHEGSRDQHEDPKEWVTTQLYEREGRLVEV